MATNDQITALVDASLGRDWQRARTIAGQIHAHEARKNPNGPAAKTLGRIIDRAEAAGMSDEVRALKSLMPRSGEAGDLTEWRPVRRGLDDVELPASARAVVDDLLAENRQADALAAQGFAPIRRLMLVGPPGCGKTAIAEAIAGALERPFVVVRVDTIVGSHLGESSGRLRKVFDFIAKAPPLVVLFDEFDAIAGRRAGGDSAGSEMARLVNGLLLILDSYDSPSILMGTTNRDDIIDDAVWRRFDEALYLPRPDDEALWRYAARRVAATCRIEAPEVERQRGWLTEALSGMSYAEAERIITRAAKRIVVRGEPLAPAFDAALAAECQRRDTAAAN